MMEKLYELILNGLRNSGGFYNQALEGTFESYLASLKEPARNLWNDYRASKVRINYSNSKTQAVYLIRYYPRYAEMCLETLRRLPPQWLNFQEEVKVCLFGSGPCPEIPGILNFFLANISSVNRVVVRTYDIAYTTWAASINITKDFIAPNLWQKDLQISSCELDLCSQNTFLSLQSTIQNTNLFIFQNCLNEIYNSENIQANIDFLLANAPLNSIVIIADLCNYKQNCNVVDMVEASVIKNHEFEVLRSPQISLDSSLQIPAIVRNYVLTGEDKLISARYVHFLFLALRKSQKISYNFSEIPF